MTATSSPDTGRHVALLLPSHAGGGVTRAFLQLANGLSSRGHRVEFVLCRAIGPYLEKVSSDIPIVELTPEFGLRARQRALSLSPDAWREMLRPILLAPSAAPVLPYIASLAQYLDSSRPDVVLSGKTHTNLLSIWARRMASQHPRVVVSERTHLSAELETSNKWRWRYLAPLIGKLYRAADAITAVSNGVSDDLAETTGLPRESIQTIYNPVARPEIYQSAELQIDHPWFAKGEPPVVLAVGRLTEQKQYPVLLEAFAQLRQRREARLLILGEGKERKRLTARVHELGLDASVSLLGFAKNPYAYMAQAAVFVLASAWEGLPGVLIEALVCGCPVVSSDCPSGPREILEAGRYGELVPVGDVEALSAAIERSLVQPPDRQFLRMRGAEFSLDAALDAYSKVLFPG
ncbi:MAG: glycosyltransferase [Deltaproteobacteria bacterium]|nr:glycosyltransferase [Deltaproteobacteria bacterium]MBW2362710.1 glycosyltransferase [Deltaproteobacteria bacterium]